MRSAALALMVAVAGCGGPWLPRATDADARRSGTDLASLARGRELLVGHCSSCHLTPSPRDHAAAQWPTEVAEMQERSKLGPADVALITQYLVAFADR